MDGRWKRLILTGLICAMTGCSLLRDKKPPSPYGTVEPPMASSDDKHRPVGANLLVQMADVRLQAALDENKPRAERESLCNDARLNYQKALQQDPKFLDAMLGMARFYAVVKDQEKCKEWYQRATKMYPTNAKIFYEEGKVLGAHFKDRENAILCLHEATKIDPENRVYRKELGFTLAWAGRYDEAYAWISRVMPEAEARYNLAGLMRYNGHDVQAKQQLVLSLQANPKYDPPKEALAALAAPPEPQQTEQQIQTVGFADLPVAPPSSPGSSSGRLATIQPPEPASPNRPAGVVPASNSGWAPRQ